jgi:hypothetical protein
MIASDSSHGASPRSLIKITTKAGDTFDAQLDLIRSTGAGWDSGTKMWRLWLGTDLEADADRLTALFRAARDYGTTVVVDVV